jgi:hypothetical protein
MAFKDKETAAAYYRKYYFEKKKPKFVPKPRVLLTEEEKKAKAREWYHKDIEKNREVARKSYQRNKEKILQRNKEWRERNKEYVKKSSSLRSLKWYKENKERHYQNGIMWKESNPDKIKEIKKRFAQRHPEKLKAEGFIYRQKLEGKFSSIKNGARRRNYSFKLTIEQFQHIIEQPCTYCGESEKKIGVDRVDNTQGYTVENSAPCCKICNMMKKDMTLENFLTHAQKIADFSK